MSVERFLSNPLRSCTAAGDLFAALLGMLLKGLEGGAVDHGGLFITGGVIAVEPARGILQFDELSRILPRRRTTVRSLLREHHPGRKNRRKPAWPKQGCGFLLVWGQSGRRWEGATPKKIFAARPIWAGGAAGLDHVSSQRKSRP